MDTPHTFRLAEQRAATDELARLATTCRRDGVPPAVRDRVATMLVDLLGVTLVGSRTPELQALAASWRAERGTHATTGSSVTGTAETVAHLDAIAACCLELDEGNKHAAGHPAAHVLFAAVAAARIAVRPVTGPELVDAVAVGYEVAARFGRATTRDPRWHTHGHWGATGAACAAALLLDATTEQVAAAIDASTTLVQVTPWEVVLTGGFSRNLWIAGANRAGLDAARLALAGLVDNDGSAQHTLGDVIGTLDPTRLVDGLGEDWLTTQGYTKQHASCSYTHAAVDAVQALKASYGLHGDDVARVAVRTHSLATPLFQRDPGSRLAAMFSLPFVVAAAVVSPAIDATTLDPDGPTFAVAQELSTRVEVSAAPALDALLPHRRAAEVTIVLHDGTELGLGVPNPIGDSDHFPMSAADVTAKVRRLVGDDDTRRILAVVAALATSTDAVATLRALP
ncbi:MmgE/PrpD family protein [Aeromicrobium sp. Root472D3]|uniref:MmgE/PrpD family protein n=1 Tax=Aeromicrobium sp. Root472D3 TaxID=1736540 RepID=UPI0009E93C1E|nr:MmgE/PrpD family protein [Aeromicrobium sp. Root472D3]